MSFDFSSPPPGPSPLFSRNLSDGSTVSGAKGGTTHSHEYTKGIDIGHVKVNGDREKFPFNNLNRQVDELTPDWMKKATDPGKSD